MMLSRLRRLQWKQTLSYTLVTVGMLFLVEMLLVIGLYWFMAAGPESFTSSYVDTTLHELLNPYFGKSATPDWGGVQKAVSELYQRGDLDGMALTAGQPILVIDAERRLRAYAPLDQPDRLGKPVDQPIDPVIMTLLDSALTLRPEDIAASRLLPNQSLWVATPFFTTTLRGESQVLAVVLLQTRRAWQLGIVTWEIVTSIGWSLLVLTLLIAPIGAFFGYLSTRTLTRRIRTLAEAADAYSQGNFRLPLADRQQDEVGQLGQRLHMMAAQLEALLQTQQQLAALEERHRLARDLHDTVKQQIFAAEMQLNGVKNLLNSDTAAARTLVGDAIQTLRQAQQELKSLILELRPGALAEKGLCVALQEYAAAWSRQSGIATHLATNIAMANEHPLPPAIALALYRIAQEALANVHKHSNASTVSLQLAWHPQQIILVIHDNGQGVDEQATAGDGFGLLSMRQRAEALNGELQIEKSATGGTLIKVTIPCA